MNKYEYKEVQRLLDRMIKEHPHPSNELYDFIHNIKSEMGLLYSTKLSYEHNESVNGFTISELVKLSHILKEHKIKPEYITRKIDMYELGFNYASKCYKESVDSLINKVATQLMHKEGDGPHEEN